MTLTLRKSLKVDETFMPVGVYPNIPQCAVNAIIDTIKPAGQWFSTLELSPFSAVADG